MRSSSRRPPPSSVGLVLAAALAIAGASCPSPGHPPASSTPEATPPSLRLVVLVVVDQLPSWIFDRDRALLDGGIARLLRTGVYYPRAELPYSATNTSSGHAALATGAPPAATGILATEWYQRDRHRVCSSVAGTDCEVFRLGAAAPRDTAEPCASGEELAVDGLADVLRRERNGRAASIAIALKLRAAILATGRRPDLAIWYEPDQGAMTTSSYYAPAPPQWLVDFDRDRAGRGFDWVWTPRDPELLARVTGIPDDAPGESQGYGFGTTFPHAVAGCTDPAGNWPHLPPDRSEASARCSSAIRVMPLGNQLVVDTALAAVAGAGLGRDDTPDLLSVSFSAHDYAGHLWGQESWERLELFLRLDHQIDELLNGLDRAVGADRYAVVLCSDHGATRMVEQSRARGRPARRIDPAEVIDAANRAARARLGSGSKPFAGEFVVLSGANLYVDARILALPDAERHALLDDMVTAIREVDGISFAARTDLIAGNCDQRQGIEAKACRSIFPGRSGEIFVDYLPDHLLTTYQAGTGHGSANPDDSIVPIIVTVPGRTPRTDPETVSTLRITATLADLLGIPTPPAAVGAPLR